MIPAPHTTFSIPATSPDGAATAKRPPAALGIDILPAGVGTMSATSTELGWTESNKVEASAAFAPSRDLFHGRPFDVMLDLETMGNKPGAAILAIGAVKFNQGGILDRFYCAIDLQSCLNAGLKIDASTVMWWLNQSDEARAALHQDRTYHISEALIMFRRWLWVNVDSGLIPGQFEFNVWGNGADFDNAMMACAYAAIGEELPWKFWCNRCYRTLKSMSSIKIERRGTHHNALDDAESQALHLLRILG